MQPHPSPRLGAIVLLLALVGCGDAVPRVVGPASSPSFGKGGSVDTDSRARLVWADQVLVNGVLVDAGIAGDDRDRNGAMDGTPDEYQGQLCGVHAKIFNTAYASNSGDLVFDPNFDYPGRSCGAERLLRVHLSYTAGGARGEATVLGPFTNVRNLWSIGPGAVSPPQAMRFNYVNQPGCETLVFNSGLYQASSDVRATGLDNGVDESGRSVRRWLVESMEPHLAVCTVTKKGQAVANGTRFLPFSVTVTEVLP